jgi:hypothetical protein
MSTRGYAKHPCTRQTCIHGFAVGRVRPYGSIWPIASPFTHLCRVRGFQLKPIKIVQHSSSLSRVASSLLYELIPNRYRTHQKRNQHF